MSTLLSFHQKTKTRHNPPAACPPSMKRAGERCLVMGREILDYQAASEHCQQEGLELISVDTEEEVEEVRALVELQLGSGCGESQGWWVLDKTQSEGQHHSLLRLISVFTPGGNRLRPI